MGMQKADIPNDPLVQETVNVFKDAIREKYKGQEYGPREEYLELHIDEHNPILNVLAETDSLDPVTASVMAAEQYASWIDHSDVAKKLNPEVADTLRLLHSADMMMGPQAMFESDNPTAQKIAVALVTGIFTGEEFEEMKAEAHPAELQMMLGTVVGPVTDLAEKLTEGDTWKSLPPKLLDRYVEGFENLTGMVTSKSQKRVMTSIAQDLKTAIAKGNAAEVTEPAQSAAPAPDSPFMQLKDKAGKLKLN